MSKLKLVPKFARVILRRAIPKQSSGGIRIPDEIQKRLSKPIGEVIAVGPTCDDSIQVGMQIYVGRMAGAWITDLDMDEEFYICNDEDILAQIEEV